MRLSAAASCVSVQKAESTTRVGIRTQLGLAKRGERLLSLLPVVLSVARCAAVPLVSLQIAVCGLSVLLHDVLVGPAWYICVCVSHRAPMACAELLLGLEPLLAAQS